MRLFIAHGLSGPLKTQLVHAIDRLKDIAGTGSYVRAENLHLTVQFIGETPAERVPEIAGILDRAAAGCDPYTLELSGPGRFVKGPESIVWYGLEGGTGSLIALHRRLSGDLNDAGLIRDTRALKPHITLARRVRLNIPWEQAAEKMAVKSAPFTVSDITLFESRRINGVLTYIPIHTRSF